MPAYMLQILALILLQSMVGQAKNCSQILNDGMKSMPSRGGSPVCMRAARRAQSACKNSEKHYKYGLNGMGLAPWWHRWVPLMSSSALPTAVKFANTAFRRTLDCEIKASRCGGVCWNATPRKLRDKKNHPNNQAIQACTDFFRSSVCQTTRNKKLERAIGQIMRTEREEKSLFDYFVICKSKFLKREKKKISNCKAYRNKGHKLVEREGHPPSRENINNAVLIESMKTHEKCSAFPISSTRLVFTPHCDGFSKKGIDVEVTFNGYRTMGNITGVIDRLKLGLVFKGQDIGFIDLQSPLPNLKNIVPLVSIDNSISGCQLAAEGVYRCNEAELKNPKHITMAGYYLEEKSNRLKYAISEGSAYFMGDATIVTGAWGYPGMSGAGMQFTVKSIPGKRAAVPQSGGTLFKNKHLDGYNPSHGNTSQGLIPRWKDIKVFMPSQLTNSYVY